ncbi:MAG: porin family protein [Rhizobiales bacterium]|nr:porin family protein [Hyphomicrobiales bacterium]
MRKISLLVVAATSLALIGTASAADLARPVYTKAAPMMPVWSWTGSYIGGYVGGAFSTNNYTNTDPFNVTATPAYKLNSSFIGGYTGGYNYQFAPNWLIGYESETGYIHMKGTGASAVAPAFGTAEIGNFYSAWTARFGYVADKSLFYAKGGVVLARFDTGIYAGPAGVGFTNHEYELGYAAGGGWEYAFDPKWSVKAEYLYLGFDRNFTYGAPTLGLTSTSHFGGIHTAKVGLNYKWDWFSLLR